MKKKRVLWLINHTTLADFEVPLLIALGYEVFTPKILPFSDEFLSGSTFDKYDSSLSIPRDDLDLLNNFDFYTDSISERIAAILNQYFDLAFFLFIPKLFYNLLIRFKGKLLLRAFGLDKSLTYSKLLTPEIEYLIEQNKSRFWFAAAYPRLAEIECPLFQERNLYLPLGIPESINRHMNTWKSEEKAVLFVCPRIATNSYYKNVYEEFKKNFGTFSHVIAGKQKLKVDDPNVIGTLERDQYDKLLKSCAAMFYHSKEPNHIHYHPIEAIVFGMPLIYMKGSLLDSLFGNDSCPGACSSYKEARKKLKRILDGDLELIQEVISVQSTILNCFSYEYCSKVWNENFSFVANQVTDEIALKNKERVIGVFLPIYYRGGTLKGAINLAKMIHLGAESLRNSVRVIFSCIEGKYDIDAEFQDLIELGIEVRETRWEKISSQKLREILYFKNKYKELTEEEYYLPVDDATNFDDCDTWYIISDRAKGPIAPLKPYIVHLYDYIQRYVPSIFGKYFEKESFSTVRNADFITVTTPQTGLDVIQYAGVKKDKVIQIPIEFNVPFFNTTAPLLENGYIIWPTNLSEHKNHIAMLTAYEEYVNNYGGKFDLVMTGFDAEKIKNKNDSFGAFGFLKKNKTDYLNKIRQYFNKNDNLSRRIHLLGDLPEKRYFSFLAHAKFLLNPTIIDNGTFSAIEAAFYRVPTLSNCYPQMRFIDKVFNLGITFANAADPQNFAYALHLMEKNLESKKEFLPKQSDLKLLSTAEISKQVWIALRKLC